MADVVGDYAIGEQSTIIFLAKLDGRDAFQSTLLDARSADELSGAGRGSFCAYGETRVVASDQVSRGLTPSPGTFNF